MQLAVVSCIHSNDEPLNAVLFDIDPHRANQIYCLGDLVGYGSILMPGWNWLDRSISHRSFCSTSTAMPSGIPRASSRR